MNISNTYIKLSGNKSDIDIIYSKILNNGFNFDQWKLKNPNDKNEAMLIWGTTYNTLDDINYSKIIYIKKSNNKASLKILLFSGYNGPNIWFKKICKKYKLSGIYKDFLIDDNFFEYIKIKNGIYKEIFYFSLIDYSTIKLLGLKKIIEIIGKNEIFTILNKKIEKELFRNNKIIFLQFLKLKNKYRKRNK